MGQRHQIYVVAKNKSGYNALGAYHHQWKYGMGAITALTKMYNMAFKAIHHFDDTWSNNLASASSSDSYYFQSIKSSVYTHIEETNLTPKFIQLTDYMDEE